MSTERWSAFYIFDLAERRFSFKIHIHKSLLLKLDEYMKHINSCDGWSFITITTDICTNFDMSYVI